MLSGKGKEFLQDFSGITVPFVTISHRGPLSDLLHLYAGLKFALALYCGLEDSTVDLPIGYHWGDINIPYSRSEKHARKHW